MKRLVAILLPAMILFFSFEGLYYSGNFQVSRYVISYNVGSNNSNVKKLEQKLKSLGYYKGNPDNYYGNDTRDAVKSYQKAKGLKADGVAGDKTLKALGMSSGNAKDQGKKGAYAGSADKGLLARAINGEARGEVYIGQVAVGAVIMNRTRDPRFPHTIAGVIYQPGAFTAISDGQIHSNLEAQPLKAAQDALNGWDPTGGCIYYYNPAKTTNKWIWSRPVVKKIGKHTFCK